MREKNPKVRGVEVDEQTRCIHYRKPIDIIAIKMKCCGEYYACKDCHDVMAGHPIEVWAKSEWGAKAVLCGACRSELTITEYLGCESHCPRCDAAFNPGCANHYHFYFAR